MRNIGWLALLAAAALGDAEKLDENLVQKDLAVARRVVAALPAEGKALDAFVKSLGPSSTEEERDIGFGARRLRVALYGGYTTTWVTVVAWGGKVGPLHVDCHEGDRENWMVLRHRIPKEYEGKGAVVGETGLVLVQGPRAGPDGFREERSRVLGPPLKVDPHPDLEEAYLSLWSPLTVVVYGWSAGDGGDEPEGRTAIERILAHESGRPLLLDLLRGPNPESRLYAAEALLRLQARGGKRSEEEAKAIEWVVKSDVPVRVARGCEMTWEPAAKPLEEMLEESGRRAKGR